jgi:hypothetical protein
MATNGSTYNFIASQTASGSSSSVTFNNIPQNYTDFRVVVNARSSRSSNWSSLSVRFNGDASSAYSDTFIQANSSSGITSGKESNVSTSFVGNIPAASATSAAYGVIILDIFNYSSPNMYKTYNSKTGAILDGSTQDFETNTGLWRSTNSITSITLYDVYGNFTSATTFSLYGIKAADTGATIPTKALGGDYISTDGTYTYHTFLNSGTFTPSGTLTCDLLMVCGGGGAANQGAIGAGGGGGSVYYNTSLSLSGPQTVLVGAGGAPDNTSSGPGQNGGISSLGSYTFASNANAGVNNGSSGSNGGNGGGSQSVISGTTTSYSGGSGSGPSGSRRGGGGAGAGANGSGINPGAGLNTYASWALATNTGDNGYYGGGGAGGYEVNGGGTWTSGGAGGGGKGGYGTTSPFYNGTAGLPNTGGGAGGCGGYTGVIGGSESNGGSGIVIVRYAS